MDPVDDVLAALAPGESRYVRLVARGSWGLTFSSQGTTRVVMIKSGECWLWSGGDASPERLSSGDCFLVRSGTDFDLRDRPGSTLVPCARAFDGEGGVIGEYGTDGPVTEIVSARFTLDRATSGPLLASLPPLVRLDLDDEGSAGLRATFGLLEIEQRFPGVGAALMAGRLADVLFVHALRAYMATAGAAARGWLAALQDPDLAPVLRELHADLAHPWTVDELARRAGMSRAALAATFKHRVGQSPIAYLTYWRMCRAKTLLRDSTSTVQQIAFDVGYDTDAAFSRAFRRHEGVPPGAWRRLLDVAAPTAA